MAHRFRTYLGQYDWMKVSERDQAAYVLRSFQYAQKNWPWMKGMLLSNLDASTTPYHTGAEDGMPWFSILNGDYSPRQAYSDFKDMRDQQIAIVEARRKAEREARARAEAARRAQQEALATQPASDDSDGGQPPVDASVGTSAFGSLRVSGTGGRTEPAYHPKCHCLADQDDARRRQRGSPRTRAICRGSCLEAGEGHQRRHWVGCLSVFEVSKALPSPQPLSQGRGSQAAGAQVNSLSPGRGSG